MDPNGLRNLRDFLQMYNRISETCFQQCISSLHQRDVETEELQCVIQCADKFINSNQRMMQTFMEVQPLVVAKRVEKMEKDAAEVQAKALAAAAADPSVAQ